MRVITFSRYFPKGHPKEGQPTFFVEKIWEAIYLDCVGTQSLGSITSLREIGCDILSHGVYPPKLHTIRSGNRWKVGDIASLRVWSGKPYRSKQVEFAQVEVKRIWPVRIYGGTGIITDTGYLPLASVSYNDGLSAPDFTSWFNLHPKSNGDEFTGQIICWSENIDYAGKPAHLEEEAAV